MSNKKVIAVIGATGAQGGGLARAILADPQSEFSVRAVTRDTSTEAAQALKQRGAELVQADLDDPASVKQAFSGAYGAFCVTFYWAHFSPEKEIRHVETMAQAAREAGLQHVIWSTLEDTRKWIPLGDTRMPTLMDRFKVPHFDAKGEADRFFVDAGVPTTFLLATFYWDNLTNLGMGPKPGDDGNLHFALPMGDEKLAGIAAEDIGRAAYGMFKAGPERLAGQFIGIAGDHKSGRDMADAMSRALKKTVVYDAVDPSDYRGLGFPGADDLGNMFQYYRDFAPVFLASRDLATTKTFNPQLQNFDTWLEHNAHKLLG